MGNSAISKRVQDLPKEPTASAGHLQLWKIWPGIRKDTLEECSVWAFDKADLLKKGRRGGEVTDKAVQEQVFQIMQRDMKLMQECECSGVVKVIDIVEETKSQLVFITERVICSVADSLYNFENIPNAMSIHGSFFESNGSISEMEISRGLYSLAEGLQVLHTVHRKLHLNLCPESVMLTSGGYMKICGLGFSLAFQVGEHMRLASPYYLKAAEAKSGVRLEPDLRYCGPELTIGGLNPASVRYLSPSCDVFALGVLCFELYRFNLKLVPEGRPHIPCVPLHNNAVQQHHSALETIGALDMIFFPHGLAPLMVGMLQPQPGSRVSTTDICNSAFFARGVLAVLRAVDTLHTRDAGTQSSQLMALVSQLSSFPSRLLVGTVLPAVSKLCLANPALWAYALPLHVHLASPATGRVAIQSYREAAGKSVAAGLHCTFPIETMQAFLRNMSFLQDCFDSAYFGEHVVRGLFVNAMDKSHGVALQLQTLTVLCDERVRLMIDLVSLLDVVVPKVCREACKNSEPQVKILALFFLSLIVARLDKAYLAKNMLPSLKYITENDKTPSVCMAVVGMYESMSESLGPEYIATSILPTLSPMLVERALDKQQFILISGLVLKMTKTVLDMRTRELSIPAMPVGGDHIAALGDSFIAARELLNKIKSQSLAQANNTPYQSLTLPVEFTPGLPPQPTTLPPSPKTAPPPLPFGVPAPSQSAYASSSYVEPAPSILTPPVVAPPTNLAGAWGGGASNPPSSSYQPPNDFLESFTKHTPAASYTPPVLPTPALSSSAFAGSSIEDQIRQTQEQIKLLSAGMGGGQPMTQQMQMQPMQMQMQMQQQQQQQQQPFMHGMGMQPIVQQGYGMGAMQGVGMSTGYKPPTIPMHGMGMMQPPPAKDPFDFLS